MQCGAKLLSSIGACAFVVTLAGCGTTPETRSDTTQQMRTAQATLDDFRNDPDMRWFREHLKDAKAVIISPRVTQAGFVFGGSGGEALVLARNDTGRWVGPAFYNIGAGSVGFQIGVDVSKVIVLVMTEKALNALLSPSFRLGGDASVAAGPVGAGAASSVTADMVSFARSKGVYAGSESRWRRDIAGQRGQRRLLRQARVPGGYSRSGRRRQSRRRAAAAVVASDGDQPGYFTRPASLR